MKLVSKKALQKIEHRRKGIFQSLVCLFFVLSTVYVYYVNTAALNGVRWKDAEQNAAALQAEVSRLEGKYLSVKKSVTLARAADMGFVDARGIVFLSGAPKVSRATNSQ